MQNDFRVGQSVSFWADDRQCRVEGKIVDPDFGGCNILVDVDGAEYCIYSLAPDVEFYQ